MAVLQRIRDSVVSLFEVVSVSRDKRVLIKDLLLEGEYSLRDRNLTRGLKKGDIFAARILDLDGSAVMSGPDDPLAAYAGDRGAEVYRACIACHTLRPDEGNKAGPTLSGVFGRKIATLPGYNFSDALKNFGALAGVSDLAFVVLPLQAKLRIGLNAFAKMFVQLTDQVTTVEEKDGEFIWTILKCPCCWGRHNEEKPVCYIATGLLLESLRWVSGGNEFRVTETKCIAVGEEICEFVIPKEPVS